MQTIYQCDEAAVQRLLTAIQEPGAMPRVQRDWLLSWVRANLQPVGAGAPTESDDARSDGG